MQTTRDMDAPGTEKVNIRKSNSLAKHFKGTWQLYTLLLLPIIFLAVFNYYPMYGAIIAFKNYNIRAGILGSPWADNFGLANFIRFFGNYNFIECLRNTLWISVYTILVSFPCAIILALSLNYILNVRYKKAVQLVSYFPYFISTIILVGMINILFNTKTGAIGSIIYSITGTNVLASASAFPSLYVWSGIWQSVGFNAIIYMAALSGVDMQLHEAATVDGATIMQRIRHIDLPAIIPTAVILLILNVGGILNIGYEKVLAMQNPNNLSASEIISTYAYKIALVSSIPDFAYSTAIGLFQSGVGLVLLLVVNRISKGLTSESLW
ncbi:ABC transporter permease [Ruminiclostridium cellobioparum]|jgi:putative aldouronate transport system permease protein|uniref:ABC transporter permease n=1 Tax=Ruminiclostridium cellobioparum TaxID=29355 RepID=UPI00068454DF|nr:ABC transporter permease subunit [Ruminiclostridium cellobioparum]